MKNIKNLLKICSGLVVISIVCSVLLFQNKFFAYLVLTDSMYPFASEGSILIITSAKSYERGEVLLYKYKNDPNILIAHRIIDKKVIADNILFETKGDANSYSDKIPVTEKEIIGKVFFVIPKIGHLNAFKFMITIFYLLVGYVLGREFYKIQQLSETKFES